ncbi:zinc-binding dehydrogenase [Colletotrichum falcatum]|nr:zinc-binding dehydrogenase [Colletotrichum falcatum]
MASSLRATTAAAAAALRPAAGRRAWRQPRQLLPRVARRHKSGPYGYTQAKALVFSKEGEPSDVLRLHTHSISPSIPSSAVLLRALAAPINPADINTIQGTYGAKPPFTQLIGTPEPAAIPGNEGVFEVVSVGDRASSSSSSSSSSSGGGLQKGDWVIPSAASFGTWRTHAVADASAVVKVPKDGLTPTQVATVSVNPCTAYRILRNYGPGVDDAAAPGAPGAMRPLDPGSGAWFIQNGANSGVGRAAIQLGRLWGLRSINVVRERESDAETARLRDELAGLGATVVVTEKEFLARDWRDRLAELTRGGREPVGLGLNCVGGRSATAVARSLGDRGTLVSYGGMARQPVALPTGLLIFRDVRFLGFWLSRWNERDPRGRRFAVDDILAMIRDGRFRDVPVQEVPWHWDTDAAVLKHAVQGALSGFRRGKGVFVFGET